MGIRLLLALTLPLAAALYILHFNRATVELRVAENLTISLPIVILVFVSALAGAFFAGLLGWSEAGLSGLSRYGERRAGRRRSKARRVLASAESLRSRGKIRAARRKARRAGRLDPSLPSAFALTGDLAAEAGDLEEAIRCSEKLYTLSPDSLEALVRLSTNLEAVGRTGEAEKMLLRMGESGVRKLILRGEIPALKLGGKWYVREHILLKSLERLEAAGTPMPTLNADAKKAAYKVPDIPPDPPDPLPPDPEPPAIVPQSADLPIDDLPE